jgi:hypothetical protein
MIRLFNKKKEDEHDSSENDERIRVAKLRLLRVEEQLAVIRKEL